MVSTHCHFSQRAAYGRARASSYCIYRFFNVARYAIPVARDAIPVARYAIRVARDAISVSREGGNLHLGGTVFLVSKETVVLHRWESETEISFYQTSW